jgi:hypothetical protein
MGIAALVLGIIATLLGVAPGMFFVAIPFGVVATVLGIVGRKMAIEKQQPTSTATAGLILGICGLAFGTLMWIACQVLVSGTKNAVEKNIAGPIKKAIEQAEKRTKEERTVGVPLDRANAVAVTATQLVAAYEANEAAADAKYKGKTVEVTGTIETIDKRYDDYIDVVLQAAQPKGDAPGKEIDGLDDVTCKLVVGENAKALELEKGKKVTVIGRCDGNVLGITLKGCLLK